VISTGKRGVFDVLRRSADNIIANWQLILIRFGEMLLFGLLAVLTMIAAFLPILIAVGIEVSKLSTLDDLENAGFALMEKWYLLGWVVLAILGLLAVFTAIHGFVEAGSARVYVDAERLAGPAVTGARSRFRLFSTERFLAGAKDGWWTLFWIYNIAWTAACLILLIPLVPTAVGLLLTFRDQQPAAVAIGCGGLAITFLLLIFVGPLTGMWVKRSINEWAVRRTGIRESLAAGRAAIRADFGRHLLICIAMIVVALAGASFFSSFSFIAAFGDAVGSRHGNFNLFFFPLRIVGSLLNSIFSAIVSAWYLASYSTLATEG
jgi:hypothetical protein